MIATPRTQGARQRRDARPRGSVNLSLLATLAAVIAVLAVPAAASADGGARGAQYGGIATISDVDCSEVTQARAQQILNANTNDPFDLDRDNDGTACDEGAGFVRVGLAQTGLDAFPLALLGGACLLGGLLLRRRGAAS